MGFPLQLLSKENQKKKKISVLIFRADFWNGDPDIDAVCRMEYAPECKFDNNFFHSHQISFHLLILKIHFYQKKF